ncbi:MAG: hypothetical protein Q7R35_14200 [Elusimicrobiota bacterium]|nr:hypothetical protein [Elusimicrobiota bacterium]
MTRKALRTIGRIISGCSCRGISAYLALAAVLPLASSPIFALDYYWDSNTPRPGALVQTMRLNVDAYLPWSSGGSAKAMGMGGAFTAIADDIGGAVEYNPAGLTRLGRADIGALVTANHNTKLNAQGRKTNEWTIAPTYAGAAFRVGRLVCALSRKQPQASSTYLKFSGVRNNLYAPDGAAMSYDTLSDTLDTKDLNTYVLTAAMSVDKLSVGANYNSIKGEVTRAERGRISSQSAFWFTGKNNRFDATEKVNFYGYTMDFGALLDLGTVRIGATARNFMGGVAIKRNIMWQDNFGPASGDTWNWISPAHKETIARFAPTYTAGAAFNIGNRLAVDLDYVNVRLDDVTKALGRLGAEVGVIPGFLAVRGGLKCDFNSLIEDQNIRTNEYFLGAGLKMPALTADASVSFAQSRAGSSGGNVTGSVSAMLKF